MSERYVHYSKKPLASIRSVNQSYEPAMKPQGLWFSVETDSEDSWGWREWCVAEQWRLDHCLNGVELLFNPDANILRIRNADELEAFHKQYRQPLHPALENTYYINWPAVATKYQGIIIAPYLWSHRLEPGMLWYYGWDCASGCVWDASCVRMVSRDEAAA